MILCKLSSFNHVLAKIAKKNGIQIGIYMNKIISSKGKNKSDIIARVIQNIKLCKKNHIQMQFVGDLAKTKNLHDKKALGLVLGMPTWMTKKLF